MSEIKSTLDLVMEKTRHLTLSQEERTAQKRIEVNKSLKGLLQKYQDNLLKKENIKKDLDDLETTYDLNVAEMMADLLLNSLKLERDNTVFIELLSVISGLNLSGLETVIQNYEMAVNSAAKKRVEQIKTDLSEKRLVSGSAIVPNLENDRDWMSILDHILDGIDLILNKEKTDLTKEISLD